jgi:uncharacterized RDD family membrane protein YckC
MNEPHLASAEFGGFWIRFLAVLVDSAIVFLVVALIIAGGAMALGEEIVPIAGFAAWVFAFLYWPVMHASGMQATFGKAILRLRVTGYQGNRISFLRSLGRELAKILSGAVFMVGYIIAGFTARKQALHDLVASTYVVSEGKARIIPAFATMVAGFVLPFVLIPLLVGGAMVDSLMGTMTAMSGLEQQQPPPVRPIPRPPVVAAVPKPAPAPPPAFKPAPAPELPKPAPEVAKPAVEAPKPVPVAQVAAPPPPVAIVPKTIEQKASEPKVVEQPRKAEAKKPEAKKVVAKKAAPAPAPAVFQAKAAGPKYNDLVTAVLYRDHEAVSELLKLGRWADKPDSRGATPLMLAVEQADAKSAEVLLKAGADPSRALAVAETRRDGAMLDLLKRYGAR